MTYRTRVRLIEAFRWNGQPEAEWPPWATPELLMRSGSALHAYTSKGPVRVNCGDWCIMGDKEISSCTDEEFHKRYEAWTAPVKQTVTPNDISELQKAQPKLEGGPDLDAELTNGT